jgi:hypothetical protein
LRPYLFHTNWSKRWKRARFKTRHFLARRKPLVVSKFGVNGSGRGKKDLGLGKRGPKKKRQVRQDNVRGFKVPKIRRSVRKRLGEQTGLWLRSPFTGRRQGTELGRMGSEPEDPTKCGSPPDGVSSNQRPPSHPPDGDDVKDGDSSMKNGSPNLAVPNREFPLLEEDRGACFGLTGGGGMKMGSSEISEFSVAGEVKPEFAVGKKLKRVMAISDIFAGGGRNACGSRGSLKSGLVVEGNILPNPFAPK